MPPTAEGWLKGLYPGGLQSVRFAAPAGDLKERPRTKGDKK